LKFICNIFVVRILNNFEVIENEKEAKRRLKASIDKGCIDLIPKKGSPKKVLNNCRLTPILDVQECQKKITNLHF